MRAFYQKMHDAARQRQQEASLQPTADLLAWPVVQEGGSADPPAMALDMHKLEVLVRLDCDHVIRYSDVLTKCLLEWGCSQVCDAKVRCTVELEQPGWDVSLESILKAVCLVRSRLLQSRCETTYLSHAMATAKGGQAPLLRNVRRLRKIRETMLELLNDLHLACRAGSVLKSLLTDDERFTLFKLSAAGLEQTGRFGADHSDYPLSVEWARERHLPDRLLPTLLSGWTKSYAVPATARAFPQAQEI